MGLNVPDLDDRTFEAFLEDARKRIPVHDPAWTDHNAHDPGITFLELFAWLGESYTYELDQVTDAHRVKYLQLLGTHPHPPRPATVRLNVAGELPSTTLAGRILDQGTELHADDGVDSVAFSTTRATTLTDASLARLVSDTPQGRTDVTTANQTPGLSFSAFGAEATAGSALYLGFDGDPFEDADELVLYIDFHDEGLVDPGEHGGEPVDFDPSVEVTWEYCIDPTYTTWYDPIVWEPITVRRDETTQFYGGGSVVLERPTGTDGGSAWDGSPGAVGGPGRILDLETPYRWLRCVVTSDGHEVPPVFDQVGVNVVPAAHCVRVDRAQSLERADGATETNARPGQTFRYPQRPVLDTRLTVGGTRWTQVETFDASSPDDHHFVLDAERGLVHFGDGLSGAVPEPGQSVVTVAAVYGGGEAGNVPATATWTFGNGTLGDLTPTPRAPPTGGTDGESTSAAIRRLRRDQRVPYRGVTAADFESVAQATPGLRIARAAARVVSDPTPTPEDCPPHDAILVVVVPESPRPRPQPSPGFLEAVDCHLKRHALVTDRVTAVEPTYVGVGVDVEVGLESGYGVAERTAAITEALDAFLHPLDGFGGTGWPFGRSVYVSEVYEVVAGVAGVDCVFDVSLIASGSGAFTDDGSIDITDTALVAANPHDVTVRTGHDGCEEGVV